MATLKDKRDVRQRLATRRAEMNPQDADHQSAAIVSYAVSLLRSQPADRTTVATYSPGGLEPGGRLLVESLRGECRNMYLPISEAKGRLSWSEFETPEALTPGRLGIPEPTGPRFGTEVLLNCSIIFVPALGVTSQGVRMGKGGGYYDRTLAQLNEAGEARPLTAVLLFDDEITDDIPVEPHDMGVDVAVTPGGIVSFS